MGDSPRRVLKVGGSRDHGSPAPDRGVGTHQPEGGSASKGPSRWRPDVRPSPQMSNQ
ncbi:hypothetical protein SODALDRAFT_332803 [Sodiomyces alkalinus F11]|uniref:Uncharacterized protein n=1 Tax=Sodiomyces alkalinus (strain CBS 110278 / VKM F-3762 / F11) TaxID=1314773 RepID=A0A3N2PXV7_SODAK|nr:hypothetical protein SODALDRAFT_332803 [Sodiomyces alkalinus F11]ROT39361.1 hypothetical protein SODALDRAFT_332803 [Sodiomyces alkalinus F11]